MLSDEPQTGEHVDDADNMFAMLSTSRNTTWQYEMHQLRMANRKMREMLDSLKSKSKKRRVSPNQSSEAKKSDAWTSSQPAATSKSVSSSDVDQQPSAFGSSGEA